MKRHFKFIVLMILGILLSGCIGGRDIAKEREAFANRDGGDITIALPGPIWLMEDSTYFLYGINMALEEVNSNGVVDGKLIKIMVENDEASFMKGTTIAQRFAENPGITAVIGHWNTHVTLPVSTIYENSGLLLLSPIVANNKLTERGYKYVFQNIPSDGEIGKEMALYAKKEGYKNIAIYYDDSSYGKGLANSFEDVAVENGMQIIDRTTSFKNYLEFKGIIDKWKALDYDAVFVADSMPKAGEFIEMLRKENPSIPIIGGDGLDLSSFINDLGTASEGVTIATLFNPNDKRESLQSFIDKFREKYDKEPDVWAVQGYESIKLLAYAINESKSSSPSDIADFLRGMENFNGVADDIKFKENGALEGRRIFKKTVKDGKFQYLDN